MAAEVEGAVAVGAAAEEAEVVVVAAAASVAGVAGAAEVGNRLPFVAPVVVE